MAVGLLTWAALLFAPNNFDLSTRAIFAWDATWAWFVTAVLIMMANCDKTVIRARAATQDEGRHMILGLAVFAAAASLAAIGWELSLAKSAHGWMKVARMGLAFVTIAGSWTFVQVVFALHYAHDYYFDPDGDGKLPHRGGLAFPHDNTPDYWDFLHFAVVIGVACQTADVAFTSKPMRRTGTWHGVVAFVFNTVLLALTINLLAGLI